MNKLFLYILICGIVTYSCKKKTSVTIQAMNPITGEGTGYADMSFVVVETWSGAFETKSKKAYEGVLNENGHANFDLKMKNNRKYILHVNEPANMCYGGLVQHYLDHEKSNLVNFEYAPCTYSKLIINNVTCTGSNDSLILYRGNEIGTFDEEFGWVHEGCVYWETEGYSDIPMGDVYYKWEVIKSGTSNTYYDTVYYPEDDTITYEINY